MSKKAFDSIMEGLTDALAYAEGDTARGEAHRVEVPTVDVKAARKRIGLSQDKFAATFGVSLSTLRKWEQGTRQPQGPAKTLLTVIEHEPEAVIRALYGSEAAAEPKPASGKKAKAKRRAAREARAAL